MGIISLFFFQPVESSLFQTRLDFPLFYWRGGVREARRGEEGKLCMLLQSILLITVRQFSNAFFPCYPFFIQPIKTMMFILLLFLFLISSTDSVSDFLLLFCAPRLTSFIFLLLFTAFLWAGFYWMTFPVIQTMQYL